MATINYIHSATLNKLLYLPQQLMQRHDHPLLMLYISASKYITAPLKVVGLFCLDNAILWAFKVSVKITPFYNIYGPAIIARVKKDNAGIVTHIYPAS